VRFFQGNHSEYEDWMKANLGEESLQPHRVKYKPLTV
jgi:hypothetical protein